MATFFERTTSTGQRRWVAQVRRDGHRSRTATFTSKRDAERWAQKLEGEIAVGRNLPDLEGERHSVAELLDRWEKELTDKRRDAVAAHLVWWRKVAGDLKLSELTAARLREFRDQLASEPYTRAVERKAVTLAPRQKRKNPKLLKRTPATVNRYFETIATALNIAVREYGWLALNPARNVKDLTEPKGRVRFLSDDERAALLREAEKIEPMLQALVITAICTGARAGELLGLRWPDVSFERRTAILHETKNGERRALSLAGPALAAIKHLAQNRRADTDLVFPDPALGANGNPRPYDYAKPFRAALKAAEITNFRFHDLRHTAASYLAMNGATTAEIAAVLGHKTLAMVKRYSHLSPQHVTSVVERMTDKVFGKL